MKNIAIISALLLTVGACSDRSAQDKEDTGPSGDGDLFLKVSRISRAGKVVSWQ